MVKIRKRKFKNSINYVKVLGLIFLLLTLMVSSACASSLCSQFEVVGNTTSNESGYYELKDIPPGNYTLIAIKYYEKNGELKCYNVDEKLKILNSTPVSKNISLGNSGTSNPEEISSLLDLYSEKATISGYTARPMGSKILYKDNVTVALLRDKVLSYSNSPHLNVSIITGYRYDSQLEAAVKRLNGNNNLNLTVSYFTPN
ncbi:MAG: carboxypeptidase-like regulatory domain-containing protein, partial [Methanosarcinaceae archaeon]|nr:carboxypeptidase-like regulatory domain-containing protein [Methanosarcinaceae archaeon]